MKEHKWRNRFAVLILMSIALGFISCSPQKRLNRLIKKNPELVTVDTIVIKDTVVIESYSVDTITRIETHDTVEVINNERVLLKYFYDTLRSEIWHEVTCKEDTVYRTHYVPHETVKAVTSTKIPFYYWLILGGLVIISFLAVLRR